MTSRPTILALVYLGLAGLWQIVLFKSLPNLGMGGLAVIYLVWPLLALSAIGLWFTMKKYTKRQAALFVFASILMIVGSLALHPQDSRTGFSNKVRLLIAQVIAARPQQKKAADTLPYSYSARA